MKGKRAPLLKPLLKSNGAYMNCYQKFTVTRRLKFFMMILSHKCCRIINQCFRSSLPIIFDDLAIFCHVNVPQKIVKKYIVETEMFSGFCE